VTASNGTRLTRAERARLEAKRSAIIDTYTDGAIDKADRDRRLAAVDTDLAAIVSTTTLEHLSAIDWSWKAADVNAILRAMFEYIQLGDDPSPGFAPSGASRRSTWRDRGDVPSAPVTRRDTDPVRTADVRRDLRRCRWVPLARRTIPTARLDGGPG